MHVYNVIVVVVVAAAVAADISCSGDTCIEVVIAVNCSSSSSSRLSAAGKEMAIK